MQCASQKAVPGNSPLFEYSLKTKDRQFDNVVVIGGAVSCHNDLFGPFVFSADHSPMYF